MVREVEIRPKHFSDIVGQIHGYVNRTTYEDPTLQKASGILSDDGNTLDISLNLNSTGNEFTATVFLLDYNTVDYSNRNIVNTALTDIKVATGNPINLNYNSIDLSSVLQIPKPTVIDTFEQSINIELFTYEANVITDYGSKRLSVPYKVNSVGDVTLNSSTDGLYTLHYANVRLWNTASQYMAGQITVHNNVAYVCKVGNTNQHITNSYYWEYATEDDIRNFTGGSTTGRESDSLITAQFSMLISRDFKQTLLYDLLNAVSFRTHDDSNTLTVLELMRTYRELSAIYLGEGDAVKAHYFLEKAKNQYNHFKSGKYTQVSDNTYTL